MSAVVPGMSEWIKSSYSGATNCVEVAAGVRVRDSRLGDVSPVLAFPAAAWAAFTGALRGPYHWS